MLQQHVKTQTSHVDLLCILTFCLKREREKEKEEYEKKREREEEENIKRQVVVVYLNRIRHEPLKSPALIFLVKQNLYSPSLSLSVSLLL